jgi:hypothetical protein
MHDYPFLELGAALLEQRPSEAAILGPMRVCANRLLDWTVVPKELHSFEFKSFSYNSWLDYSNG